MRPFSQFAAGIVIAIWLLGVALMVVGWSWTATKAMAVALLCEPITKSDARESLQWGPKRLAPGVWAAGSLSES